MFSVHYLNKLLLTNLNCLTERNFNYLVVVSGKVVEGNSVGTSDCGGVIVAGFWTNVVVVEGGGGGGGGGGSVDGGGEGGRMMLPRGGAGG
jgi:hypothetical protein